MATTKTIDRHVSIVLGDGTVVDNSNPLPTSGGGGSSGTQYADGTAVNPATATAILWNDAGTVRVPSAAKPFPVNVVAGSGSGLSVQDEAAWTAGTSNFVPGGGVFNDSATALTSGQQGTLRVTAQRGQHVNLRNNSGTEIGTSGNPVRTDPTGTTTQPVSAASLPLPTGAAVGAADEAAWTAGTSIFNPVGGVFNDSAAALTAGQQGAQRLTANRAGHVNLRDASGNELTPVTLSTANSTTTPLAGNAAFTGTGEDVSRYGSVQVTVFADQAAATNGLSLQWSSDNSHWDLVEAFGVAANQAVPVRAAVKAKFFRVVYTNGTTLQGTFRLQTFYQAALVPGTSATTLGSFPGPLPGAQFAIAMPYTFDSSASTWGPVMGAKNLVTGIAGGALPSSQGMVYNTGDTKFYPALSAAAGSGTTGIMVPATGPLLWDSVGGVNFVKQAGDGSGRTMVVGAAAHGATVAGNPLLRGGQAIAHGTNPTAVTAGQATTLYANRAGVPFVIGGHPNVQTIRANYTTAQTDTAIISVSAGSKIVVTGFLVTVDNACTVNVPVRLGFGTTTTPTTTGVIGAHPNVAPGSGFGRGGGTGIVGVGADDADLRITSGVPTGGSIDVTVSYYTIES